MLKATVPSVAVLLPPAFAVIGEVDVVEREVDATGQVYMTAAELMAEEVKRRGGEWGRGSRGMDGGRSAPRVTTRADGRQSGAAR